MRPARIIVTRPERDAARWVNALAQRGLPAEALPLIRIEALPESPALQQAWRDITGYAALMFVSGNAVAAFFGSAASNAGFAHVTRGKSAIDLIANTGLRCLAPGPGTVTALHEAGVPAAQIDAPAEDAGQFDSEALWAVVAQRDWQGRRVLIVRGQSAGASAAQGRDWLAQQLSAAGAQPEFLAVYRRSAPLFTAQQRRLLQDAAVDGSVWLFSSSEAVGHLPPGDWSQARAVATHPRIAEAVRAAGWGVVAESRPALDDIVASIESMQP